MKLEALWKKEGSTKNLRVRYKDWSYKLKFFQIQSFDEKTQTFTGINEHGEVVSYPITSDHWELYFEGLENQAKAV